MSLKTTSISKPKYHKPICITSLRDFVICVFPVFRNILSLTGQYLS